LFNNDDDDDDDGDGGRSLRADGSKSLQE
jgi:hypothetical protein